MPGSRNRKEGALPKNSNPGPKLLKPSKGGDMKEEPVRERSYKAGWGEVRCMNGFEWRQQGNWKIIWKNNIQCGKGMLQRGETDGTGGEEISRRRFGGQLPAFETDAGRSQDYPMGGKPPHFLWRGQVEAREVAR